MKIAFIGGGTMGEAMLSAILSHKLTTPADITVSEPDQARRQKLQANYRVNTVTSNPAAVQQADIIILSIKPQTLPEVLPELRGKLFASQLVMSIIAGAKIAAIASGLNHRCLVRVMPNTPAQIGEGASVWTATPSVTTQQRAWTKSILAVMGEEIFIEDEKLLDAVTAVSGSGPAYVFLFIETLTSSAIAIGLPPDMAEKIVLQTLLGSGHLLQKSGKGPAELRHMVTSPGGTTAAAIAKLEAGGFTELIKQAVAAAYERSLELGKTG